jgi:diguanylate cyclase (GGDEF)-like protein
MNPLPPNLRRVLDRDARPWRLLVLGGGQATADRVRASVHRQDDRATVHAVQTLAEALDEDLSQTDLLLCHLALCGTGIDCVLEELLLERPDLPVIVLVDAGCSSQADHARHAIALGAYDTLALSHDAFEQLPMLIDKNLAIHSVRQENARLQVQLTSTLAQLKVRNQQLQSLVRELETIAATDALTGIANRRALTEALEQRYAAAVRDNRDLALLVVDMDGFKALNDAVGHAAGDRVLQLAAQVLKANCRASDVPGRIGGDEFVVVLPETGLDEARAAAERIRLSFAEDGGRLCQDLGYTGRVSMSIGIATRSFAPDATADQLLGFADRALYCAKSDGKHRVAIHGQG